MVNQLIRVTSEFTRQKASQSAAWAVFVRDTISGFITTVHHTVLVLGIIAIGALSLMFIKPEVADRLLALSPFAESQAEALDESDPALANLMDMPAQSITEAAAANNAQAAMNAETSGVAGNSLQQQWVTAWLSKRYRVAADATNMLVSAAYMTAQEIKLDPLLILSVMAIESGFNPFAESPVGAQGLMQVMSKVHRDKFEDLGGVKAALNPVANIRVGSLILKDYVKRGGSVEAGLKLYVGAGAFDSDSGYGARVLEEYQRLKEVSMGKKVPIYTTSASSASPKARPQGSNKTEQTAEETPTSADHPQPLAKADQFASL
ncbi:MAG TPA: lytic transglycosylase domain-containing protein [Noviherbaspirillum sp.]|nr:lytic transglycosylase domain-containing protein [Noviherbaspirillum sp.]